MKKSNLIEEYKVDNLTKLKIVRDIVSAFEDVKKYEKGGKKLKFAKLLLSQLKD